MEARDLFPAFGAEIVGLDFGSRLDDDEIRLLREVFDTRGLLLFRDADLDRPYQVYLSVILRGHEPPTEEEAIAGAIAQNNFTISNKVPEAAAPFGRLLYHSDGMWSDEPFEVLSLYATDVEPPVPPTLFASAAHAWATLPADLRARVEGLHAQHVTGPEYIHERRRRAFEGELSQAKRSFTPSITTPVAYRHPRTGATLCFVAQGMTNEIVELDSEASEDLLEELFAHLYRDDAVYAHDWRNGDLLVWDNLALQHARPNVTLDGPARTFCKVGLPMPTNVALHMVDDYEQVS